MHVTRRNVFYVASITIHNLTAARAEQPEIFPRIPFRYAFQPLSMHKLNH